MRAIENVLHLAVAAEVCQPVGSRPHHVHHVRIDISQPVLQDVPFRTVQLLRNGEQSAKETSLRDKRNCCCCHSFLANGMAPNVLGCWILQCGARMADFLQFLRAR